MFLLQNIQRFMDEAKEGVIYMSMGSILLSSLMPEVMRKNFLKIFSHLPQTVIWKWENDTMNDKPDNVVLMKWAPQRDLLCMYEMRIWEAEIWFSFQDKLSHFIANI